MNNSIEFERLRPQGDPISKPGAERVSPTELMEVAADVAATVVARNCAVVSNPNEASLLTDSGIGVGVISGLRCAYDYGDFFCMLPEEDHATECYHEFVMFDVVSGGAYMVWKTDPTAFIGSPDFKLFGYQYALYKLLTEDHPQLRGRRPSHIIHDELHFTDADEYNDKLKSQPVAPTLTLSERVNA